MARWICFIGLLAAVAVIPFSAAEDMMVTVCDSELMEASCPENHVVMFRTATYGRTANNTECPGEEEEEAMDCEEDVLPTIKDHCSSTEQECDLEVTSENLGGDICVNSTSKYLKATYYCAPVMRSVTCEGWNGWNENNMTMNINCDNGVIRYVWANYGRLELHDTICSTQRTDCDYSANTTGIVQDMCDGRKTCSVEATNDVLGNNCRMTYKYLEIIYGCKTPNKPKEVPDNKTMITCEKSDTINPSDYIASISCPGKKKIQIVWANWGRLKDDSEVCDAEPDDTVFECQTMNTTDYLLEACGEDSPSCSIEARNENFGTDPCPGVYKYLDVHYACEEGSDSTTKADVQMLLLLPLVTLCTIMTTLNL